MPVARLLAPVARVLIPAAYAVLYYVCAIYLRTEVAAALLGFTVMGMSVWFVACMRIQDDRRASHLAQQGFIAKVLSLPLEVVVVIVYAGVFGAYSMGTWLLSAFAMYLGLLGGSLFVAGAARQARAEGLVTPTWGRVFAIAAFVPVFDALAATFLWFAILKKRLFEA